MWNWWVDSFIAQSIDWCDISECLLEIHFPFYGAYFSQEKWFLNIMVNVSIFSDLNINVNITLKNCHKQALTSLK